MSKTCKDCLPHPQCKRYLLDYSLFCRMKPCKKFNPNNNYLVKLLKEEKAKNKELRRKLKKAQK